MRLGYFTMPLHPAHRPPSQTLQEVLRQPEAIEKFRPQGLEPMPLSPAEFDALIAKEIENNIAIVKAAGL
jgi:tripartite-type tricarboxylate transporter receptor subunit TctC